MAEQLVGELPGEVVAPLRPVHARIGITPAPARCRWVEADLGQPGAAAVRQRITFGHGLQASAREQRFEEPHAEPPGQVAVAAARLAQGAPLRPRPGLVAGALFGDQCQRLERMRHLRAGQPEVTMAPAWLADHEACVLQLGQVAAGRGRGDRGGPGQFARGGEVARQQVAEHARACRVGHHRGDAGQAGFVGSRHGATSRGRLRVPATSCSQLRSSRRMKRSRCARSKFARPSGSRLSAAR